MYRYRINETPLERRLKKFNKLLFVLWIPVCILIFRIPYRAAILTGLIYTLLLWGLCLFLNWEAELSLYLKEEDIMQPAICTLPVILGIYQLSQRYNLTAGQDGKFILMGCLLSVAFLLPYIICYWKGKTALGIALPLICTFIWGFSILTWVNVICTTNTPKITTAIVIEKDYENHFRSSVTWYLKVETPVGEYLRGSSTKSLYSRVSPGSQVSIYHYQSIFGIEYYQFVKD